MYLTFEVSCVHLRFGLRSLPYSRTPRELCIQFLCNLSENCGGRASTPAIPRGCRQKVVVNRLVKVRLTNDPHFQCLQYEGDASCSLTYSSSTLVHRNSSTNRNATQRIKQLLDLRFAEPGNFQPGTGSPYLICLAPTT